MEKSGPYTVYETPSRVLDLVREDESFTARDVAAELYAFHTRARSNGEGHHSFPQGKLFYRQDTAFTPIPHAELKKTPREKMEVIDPLRDTLERIRAVVAEALREHGAEEVLRAGQTSRGLKEYARTRRSIGWAPLRGYPGKACKLTEHAMPFVASVNDLSHPHLAKEHLVPTTHPKRRITIADDASGIPVLSQMITKQPKEQSLKVLMDAMTALEYMHKEGFVHRDFKPENIFVCTTHGDEPFGKLFDLDLALPAGTKNGQKTTETYADGAYFDYPAKDTYETSTDVFAAGVSLLLVLSNTMVRTRTMLRNLLAEEAKSHFRNADIENVLGRYCNHYLKHCPQKIISLVRSMIVIDRVERPTITEVLTVLRSAQF